MLKLRKNCKKEPKRIVRVRKNGNLREATVDNIFLVFQDSNKERLLEEVDHYLRELGEVEKADADISKDIVLGREPDFYDFMVYRRFLDEEKVLMLLAISENPIDFLCEILKQ